MADLLIEKHGRTTVFTINRPESRNTLNHALMADLTEGIRAFNADPEQFVAIITGAGDKAFSSGADLKNVAGNVESGRHMPMAEEPDLAGVGASEKPIIAAVNGVAVAGGFELALCCDIRIASETAWFGVFEVKWGIMAGIAVNVLPRLLPMGVAMDLLLSAERLSAADAWRLGLVQKVVPPEQLMEEALRKANMIAANSQTAVWGTKKVLKFWRDALLAEQHRYYEAIIHRVLLSGDVHEGPKAFTEKRAPQFKNRWPEP
jgi:enoyl-CoA hydratase/carnithine racemase